MADNLLAAGVALEPEEEQKLHAFASAIDADKRNRYRRLRRKLEAECLTSTEHQELIALTDEVEMINVARMEFLAEIGKRHHLSLAEIVRQLHISPLLP
jgi:hypothetical protein